MDTLQPRADWEAIGEKWFRKTQTYTAVFDPDLDLDNYVLVGAPFAGAVGMSINCALLICMSEHSTPDSRKRYPAASA